MTTKLNELKALLADREKIGEYVAVSLDQPDLRALIAVVEALRELRAVEVIDYNDLPELTFNAFQQRYAAALESASAALAPFGENDEQKP